MSWRTAVSGIDFFESRCVHVTEHSSYGHRPSCLSSDASPRSSVRVPREAGERHLACALRWKKLSADASADPPARLATLGLWRGSSIRPSGARQGDSRSAGASLAHHSIQRLFSGARQVLGRRKAGQRTTIERRSDPSFGPRSRTCRCGRSGQLWSPGVGARDRAALGHRCRLRRSCRCRRGSSRQTGTQRLDRSPRGRDTRSRSSPRRRRW